MCGRSQAKVRGTVARPERTGPTFGCGSGSESLGVRRGRQGRPRFRRVCLDNLAGAEGVEETRPQAGRFESPPGRRRTQESSGDRAALGGGSGLPGRAGNPRRPRIAVAMDLQESSRPGQPAPGNGPCHQLPNRRDAVAPGGVQSSSKSESQRRSAASGPQRPIRTHLPRGAPATVGRATGDLGGHQEEGVGRGLQEPRARVASAGNAGWVSIGIDHDTAAFAVNSIRRWWRTMGRRAYPQARVLLITADSGGSNGARTRLWKWELQRLATESGLSISVRHLPPGTSKWNKIEHRLFSFISRNWRGRPLVSLATIISLIAATRTRTGMRVRCELDPGRYPRGEKITDAQMSSLNIERARYHGDWNYTIHPRQRSHR